MTGSTQSKSIRNALDRAVERHNLFCELGGLRESIESVLGYRDRHHYSPAEWQRIEEVRSVLLQLQQCLKDDFDLAFSFRRSEVLMGHARDLAEVKRKRLEKHGTKTLGVGQFDTEEVKAPPKPRRKPKQQLTLLEEP